MHIVCAGADTGGRGVPYFSGTPKLHKEGKKNVVCVREWPIF